MYTFGPTETEILHLLWQHGPATAGELHKALRQQRRVAYTTVKTTVDRLCEKGTVTRQTLEDRKGDPYLYTPVLTRAELLAVVTLRMCKDLDATADDRRVVCEALTG